MFNLAFDSQLHMYMKSDLLLDLWNGWSDGEESRPWNELWLVVDGGARLTVDDKEYQLQKGDFCLLPDVLSKAHRCEKASNFKLWVIQFEGSLVTGSIFKQFSCSDWVVHLSDDEFDELRILFERSANHSVRLLPFERVLQVNRDLYILVENFFSRVRVINRQKNDWLNDTLCYIAEHFGEKLSVEHLARRVMMHPKHFTRCFRDRTGDPPGRYIAKVRLEQATTLLLKGTPMYEISERIGFQSLQQFFRFFKKHTGMTPREYKNNYMQGGKSK